LKFNHMFVNSTFCFIICYPFSFFKVFINVHMFLKIYSHEKTRYLTGFVQHDFVILTIVYKF